MRDELTLIVRNMQGYAGEIQDVDPDSAQAMFLDADKLMQLLAEYERTVQQLDKARIAGKEAEGLLEKAAIAGANYQGKAGALETDIQTLQARVAELEELLNERDLDDAKAINAQVQELMEMVEQQKADISQLRVENGGLRHQLRKAKEDRQGHNTQVGALEGEADSAYQMLRELMEIIALQPNIGTETQAAFNNFLKKYELEVEPV